MGIKYRITPELRTKLKIPLGTLIQGPFHLTSKKIKERAEKEKPPVIISVGDIVSKILTRNNLNPDVSIVDNKVMRKRIQPVKLGESKTLYTDNPPGIITEEAQEKIKEALKQNQRVKLVVDGEEDLLTLPAIVFSPEGAFVVYGQPFEGAVLVKVTDQKKSEVMEILNIMRNFEKLNKEKTYQGHIKAEGQG